MPELSESDHRQMRDHGLRRTDCGFSIAIVALSVLVAAGPTLVGLAHVLPPLVLAMALAAALLRLVWFVTTRRSS